MSDYIPFDPPAPPDPRAIAESIKEQIGAEAFEAEQAVPLQTEEVTDDGE